MLLITLIRDKNISSVPLLFFNHKMPNHFQVVKFDEEGAAVQDAATTKVSEEGKRYEAEDEDISGINIDKAKLILRAEDKFDKIFEREKIKNRKREEKRKLKEAKKRKNGAQVMFLSV